MSRPVCPICTGSGEVLRPGFRSTGKKVARMCEGCRGRGTLAVKVDVYDILEWLREIGTGGFMAAADSIEKKWGVVQASVEQEPKKP